MIDQSLLKSILIYREDTGQFFWKVATSDRITIGDIAGTVCKAGHVQIGIFGKLYIAHRLVWLYVYGKFPDGDIDHINHIRYDNRLCNLRDVPHKINQKNLSRAKNNSSGITGVHWSKERQKWCASITINKKVINLGRYDDVFEAICARKSSESLNNFHNNHGKNMKS